jgi:excinuclease ABC subunit C
MKGFSFLTKENINKLPTAVGVYAFKKEAGVLYIGKAINIKERVKSHFNQPTFKDSIFIPKTQKIGFLATGSEIEALLLEAQLIKKYQPRYNAQWKDSKNYFFTAITKEDFPRVFITHQLLAINHQLLTSIGPFADGNSLKQVLRILRKVFPYRTCRNLPKKPCLYYELRLCQAPCLQKLKMKNEKLKTTILSEKTVRDYKKNIENLIKVLRGQKTRVLSGLKREMQMASKNQDYEKAKTLRDQALALENIFQHSHILSQEKNHDPQGVVELQKLLGLKRKIKRIEGYDISNIQGQEATGSMVVFENGQPNKNEYRKFKIKRSKKPNDTAMLREALERRLKHQEWPLPEVMLVDGGIGQLNVALKVKSQNSKGKSVKQKSIVEKIRVITLAKRKNELFLEGQKKPVLLKNLPKEIANLILRVRDEAHRFAISYHKKLRNRNLLNPKS